MQSIVEKAIYTCLFSEHVFSGGVLFFFALYFRGKYLYSFGY
jgi:hypothetical protein